MPSSPCASAAARAARACLRCSTRPPRSTRNAKGREQTLPVFLLCANLVERAPEDTKKVLTDGRFGRALIAVEVVSVLRHQIQQQHGDIELKDMIIGLPRMTKQRLDIMLWTAIGQDHCQSQRRCIARIAKAEIVDIYDAGEFAAACDNDVFGLRIMEKRCRPDGIKFASKVFDGAVQLVRQGAV